MNRPTEAFLWVADNTLGRITSLFIIAGVVLSCLHQSSLGTLMVLVPTKMHPLWYTHLSPLLFLLSAIMVGFPMVVFESVLASKSFKLKPETKVLGSIARYTPFLLGIYLALKIGDIIIRGVWPYVLKFDTPSQMWLLEMLVGVVAPLIILYRKKWRYRVGTLFTGAALVIIGVVLNRLNVFLVAYTPLYQDKPYFPTIYEILVTAGFIAALVLLYRLFVRIFPIISVPADQSKQMVQQEPARTFQIT